MTSQLNMIKMTSQLNMIKMTSQLSMIKMSKPNWSMIKMSKPNWNKFTNFNQIILNQMKIDIYIFSLSPPFFAL
ncbi:hypothetical protein [Plasmodium yoelii yoelii]|uniref:Uncharacterized protein n=1 Tax=Plasmodium yoelii yoelii TaxID=73239 RepID=Q7RPC1_PLAYO|nr:hypothetical protein [Plasmodium yoelii yoelii]